jgi:hypothetical protein
MAEARISEQIVDAITESTHDDAVLKGFLLDLLYEEAEHAGRWWWKEIYRKKLKRAAERCEGADEDQ